MSASKCVNRRIKVEKLNKGMNVKYDTIFIGLETTKRLSELIMDTKFSTHFNYTPSTRIDTLLKLREKSIRVKVKDGIMYQYFKIAKHKYIMCGLFFLHSILRIIEI